MHWAYGILNRMKQRLTRGFTIVELLIVIVVIAILAAITIVAFNGVQDRARYTSMKSDLDSIHKALEMYKVDHGDYPNSADCVAEPLVGGGTAASYQFEWCGWSQGSNDSFIPGLAPKYLPKVKNLPKSDDTENTYLYKSSSTTDGMNNGTTYYQLIRFKRSGLTAVETKNATDDNSLLKPGYEVDGKFLAWGLKSDETIGWW